ncbi:MAG: hypothetical protein JNM68_07110 [Dinghuibacter sp.]|nr:hypothetical protein [Dinghuibacter sp.]
MPFTLIKGKFMPGTGLPDGDSVRFKPNNPKLLNELEGVKAKLAKGGNTMGSVQLRFEGIDAIEKGATKPLSVLAKENMLKLIGYDSGTNPEPEGYVLARMTDPNGRPLAYVFAGSTARTDGSDVFLDAATLGTSVNYKQMLAGFAYPMYYNTLFAVLREKFNQALNMAKQHNRGYWSVDKTLLGVSVTDKSSLATINPVWPKIWRRLEEFLEDQNSLDTFSDWLQQKNERVILIKQADEIGLADIIKVQGKKVKMLQPPENLMVVTAIKRR